MRTYSVVVLMSYAVDVNVGARDEAEAADKAYTQLMCNNDPSVIYADMADDRCGGTDEQTVCTFIDTQAVDCCLSR